jgi:beta-galactosidase GanA
MILKSLFLAYGLLSTAQAIAPFTWNNETFLLHGKPFQIIGGQMDPQRIPHELWEDRLSKARAMGLNTIFSYVYWDQLEPSKGTWESSGNNDIARYFKTAQEQGLNVVLRPGPYICGEHEWGGFPAWLSEVPGMVVRANNKPFLGATQSYIDNLAKDLEALSVNKGGPILMVQVENEYGSYGSDHQYVGALRDMFRKAFGLPLYTNDGGAKSMIEGGQIHGALAETDGDPKTGFSARNQYVTDPTSLGPQLDGEYYVTWLDQWASNKSFATDSGNAASIQNIQSDLDWILKQNGSFSIYMFHGGTNWGFQNGADWGDSLEPITTSYDYGAPLDESGRPNDIYDAIRQTIGSHVGADSIPPVPADKPLVEIPPIKLTPSVGLFDSLPKPIREQYPVNMEAVGQSTGFTLYRHVVGLATNGVLQPGDTPRDRVLVYVNGHRIGVIDNTYTAPSTVKLNLKKHDVLDLLIENLGRVNYGPRIIDQRKGIVGNVTVGDDVLSSWDIYPLPLNTPPSPTSSNAKTPQPSAGSGPIFYIGTFDVNTVGDTFLELPGWTKGAVWVNGVNLGRYWIIGPQQTLYLPGVYLKETGNRIDVLALEPTGNEGSVSGTTSRKWGNHPDPDAL